MNINEIIKKATLSSLKESGLITEDAEQDKELHRQQRATKDLAPFKAPTKKSDKNDKTLQDKKSDDADEADDDAGLKPKSPKSEKLPQITVRKIIDKIDDIRAGYSLHTKKGIKDLTLYFNRLSKNEQIALYAFLAGLESVLGENPGNIKTPHSQPFNVDMEQEKPKKSKPKGAKEPSIGDGNESPIIVGESQDKSSILRIIKSNRRRT